jgi:hypothetical protein
MVILHDFFFNFTAFFQYVGLCRIYSPFWFVSSLAVLIDSQPLFF